MKIDTARCATEELLRKQEHMAVSHCPIYVPDGGTLRTGQAKTPHLFTHLTLSVHPETGEYGIYVECENGAHASEVKATLNRFGFDVVETELGREGFSLTFTT